MPDASHILPSNKERKKEEFKNCVWENVCKCKNYVKISKVSPNLIRRQLSFVDNDVRRKAADVESGSRPRDSVRYFLPEHENLIAKVGRK